MSKTYYVQAGDFMEKIADQNGFRDYHTIYDHANNSAFKARRPNPHILYPLDEVFIPDIDPGNEPAVTDKKHTLVLKPYTVTLKVKIRRNDKPFAYHKYTLKVSSLADPAKQTTFTGETGADGLLIQKAIPVRMALGVLTFPGPPSYTRRLNLGFLHPVTLISGVQMRLNNLGFGSGPATGAQSAAYTAALQAFQTKFQKQYHLPNVTGTLDDDTINALRAEYDHEPPS
jgi:hypothetical protein